MIIQQAIEKAIEGGWDAKGILKNEMAQIESIDKLYGEVVINFQWVQYDYKKYPCKITREMMIQEVFLDPLFWQSLGKAMGWDEEYFHRVSNSTEYDLYNPVSDCWKMMWHRFIDHLAEGKDAESFFANL